MRERALTEQRCQPAMRGPAPTRFEVEEDPVDGWTYDPPSRFLTFNGNRIPPRGSTITIRYTVDPGYVVTAD